MAALNSSVMDSSAYVLRNTRLALIALGGLAGLMSAGREVAESGRALKADGRRGVHGIWAVMRMGSELVTM
jgi:hypothetical protein